MIPPLRILVIDDDPVMRELLEALLGFAGHDAQTVSSGDAALPRLATESFDLVLTDLHMPGLQGHHLATELLKLRGPDTLLVGMSGSHPTVEETHLLDHFLHKPFTPEQFEQAVKNARAKHEQDLLTGSTAMPTAKMSAEAESQPLDEAVYSRMAAMIPADQLRALYLMTIDDVLARVGRMTASFHEGDFDAVRREAHSIKGGCGMVGATEIYALASTTEGGTSPDAFPLAEFAPACERLKRMLDARLATAI